MSAHIHVREDLAAAHDRAWARLARAGTWWTGAERVAIAAEVRRAPACPLCARRKAALSPYTIGGAHDGHGSLPAPVVEVVHRVRTDPGRLTRSWYEGILAAGLSVEKYVETIGVIATVVAVDTFARGLGMPPRVLPQPEPGAPTRARPKARPAAAWVPWLEPADLTAAEAGIYPTGRPPANIHRAMSLVPDEVRGFFDLVEHQYLGGLAMRDFAREYRAISHAQIELVAGRVSAINGCEY
jgi:hypothetical protein